VKVAIVSDGALTEDFGQFSAALAAQGHDVTAYVRQQGGRRTRKSTQHDYRVVPVSVGPGVGASDRDVLPFVGDWAATLERSWSSTQPDIVHTFGWLGGLAAQLAARRRRLPTVQSFRGLACSSRSRSAGSPDHYTERERIEPLLARNATWVTAESTADIDALATWRHSRARLSVLAGGVDTDRYTPVGSSLARSGLYRILCLAPNPLDYNGFDISIRALSRVPGTELFIAETDVTHPTHDEARAVLKQLATELGVADRVQFAGTVAGDQLPKLLRSADVVACTPRQPPRATTALRAMASGVAVIALPVGVLSDVVVHAVTGFLLSPNSPDELVNALRILPAQRFQCRSMGAAGRNRVVSRFTWDRVAHESLAIYQRLSSPYSRPAAPQLARAQ
jgi:glycosyltransferase involved in cell wall biosynthesis